MFIPLEFYYRETVGRVSYTRVSTGKLSVNQLILGKPFFVMNALQRELKQKKLILSDWTAPYWSAAKTQQVYDAIAFLIDQRFAVYVYQNGIICCLTKNNLSSYLSIQNRLKITPIHERALLKAASRQQLIGRDQLQVLDDYWLQAVIGDDYPSERLLKTAYLFSLKAVDLINALQGLSHLKPKVDRIIYDGFPTNMKYLSFADQWLRNIPAGFCISALAKLNDFYLSKVIQRMYSLKLSLDTIIEDEISYSSHVILKVLVSLFPRIQTIVLERFIYCSTPDEFNQLLLTVLFTSQSRYNIEVIEISPSSVGETQNTGLADLNKIFARFPNIRKISLPHFKLNPEELDYFIEPSFSLEALHLSNDALITPDFLKALIKSAPNLNSFLFEGTGLGNTSFDFLKGTLLEDFHGSLSDNLGDTTVLPTLVDPTHDLSVFKEFKSPPDEGILIYDKQNVSLNQGMIIAKLSQYLLNKNQHRATIVKLQNGICLPLSYFFKEKTREQWDDFIRQVAAWDLDILIDDSLKTLFDELFHYIEEHQFKPVKVLPYYLVDNLEEGIRNIEINQSVILNNPWHVIAVRRVSLNQFDVYDPNYVAGVKTIAENKVSAVLNTSIGKLVGFNSDAPLHIKTQISSPDHFIRDGGLLALCNSCNAEDMLDELMSHFDFSKEALDGLLLLSLSGFPAWVSGLKHTNPRIRELTTRLLTGLDSPMVLQKNLKDMSGFNKQQLTIVILQELTNEIAVHVGLNPLDASGSQLHIPSKKSFKRMTDIVKVIRLSNQRKYEQRLATWESRTSVTGSLEEYCQMLVSPIGKNSEDKRKTLVKIDSTEALDSLSLALKNHGIKTSRPVFYIDKPDDLLCYTPCVVRHDLNQGILTNGPVGPLHDFLKLAEEKAQSPILLVNYERFNADDMVRFNGLLDKARHADRRLLPENAVIIGLLNTNKPDCYQGADFYSRFNKKETCPFSASQIKEGLPKYADMLGVSLSDSEERTMINLYHSPDW